ncbi:MAG: GatB/YqeY domain-containing protein, partial [Betaproteobacteria bacterium]|nr:GatB/YqeY domain-containing protein [Betaproteobacteria bacterium]
QRQDSVSQYEAAGRQDLADVEKFEITVLAAYLPARMDAAAIAAEVAAAMRETGAQGMADMGKLMAALKPRLAGKADMAEVSRQVKAALA